jgi:hypothetical protein
MPPQAGEGECGSATIEMPLPETGQLVIGRGDENGTRLKLNLETPSLNSFVFEYMTPSC